MAVGGNFSRRPRPPAGRRLSRQPIRSGPQPPASTLPTVTLGKTGQKVPVLGMGTSWDLSPSFVQAALHAGVRYIDTSESYESGNVETTLGEVLERTKMRKDVYLVTKNSRGKVGGSRAFPTFEKRLTRAWSGCGPTTSTATTFMASPVARSRCSAIRT